MFSLNVHCINSVKNFPLSRTIYWAKKSGFTVLDQGLLAGANFLVNILLARWLEPAQYGAFAVAYSVFMFIGTLYAAVLTEPMMFFGAGKYAETFRKYLGILIYGHWALTVGISVILSIVAVGFWQSGSKHMAQALAGLAIALPFMLHYWLVRGGFYTQLRVKWAIAGSTSNLILMFILVFGLMRMNWLSPGSALIAIGFAGLASSMGLLLILRPQLRFAGDNPTPMMILTDHWRYGSWIVLARGIWWSSGQVLIVLVPIFLGLQASAIFAVVLNLFWPVRLLTQSASLLIVPELSALVSKGINAKSLMNQTKRFAFLFSGGVFVYGMLMYLLGDLIIYHLYGGKYGGYSFLVFLLALSSTAQATVIVFTVILRSIGKVREMVVVWGLSSLIVLPLSVPVLLLGGLHGAILLFTCSYITAGVVAWRRLLDISPQNDYRMINDCERA